MTCIVLVETNGTVKSLKAKDVSRETLYKKCGFRIPDDFLQRNVWNIKFNNESYKIGIWAKQNGKATFENKYDFPPPIDNDLYFGTCAIIRLDNDDNIIDFTKEMWENIYNKLFGGFIEIGDEDEYSEDELENVDPKLLTSHGYLKDDFIVSDKECIESSSSTQPSPSTTPPKKKCIPNIKTAKPAKPVKTSKEVIHKVHTDIESSSSELEEDVYTFSDDD